VRKTLLTAAVAACIAVGSVFAFVGIRSNDLEDLSHANCVSINEANAATADVFRLLQKAAAENPDRTALDKERADKFFKAVYARLEPRDC
jgi:hypothetical protein